MLLSVRSGFSILEPSHDRTVSSVQKLKGRWWIGSVGKSRIYAYQMCHYFFHDTYAANRISNHSLFPLDKSSLAISNYSGSLEGTRKEGDCEYKGRTKTKYDCSRIIHRSSSKKWHRCYQSSLAKSSRIVRPSMCLLSDVRFFLHCDVVMWLYLYALHSPER